MHRQKGIEKRTTRNGNFWPMKMGWDMAVHIGREAIFKLLRNPGSIPRKRFHQHM
jgi:hypothetical protein